MWLIWEKIYIRSLIKDVIESRQDALKTETDSKNIESLENDIEDLEKLYIKIGEA
jgi:hypothetical protein